MKLTTTPNSWLRLYVFRPLVIALLLANVTFLFLLLSLSRGMWPSWCIPVALTLSLAASAAGLIVLHRRARESLTSEVLRPAEKITEAGNWILAKTLGGVDDLSLPEGTRVGDQSKLEHQLQQWLDKFRADMEIEVGSRTKKMERDLELAKDFQRAMLERPYPDIPEVHIEGRLRLEFYHVYEPADELGGDFFDILTLGPDCAGVFIADVMGHGTRSSLITAILRTLLGDLIQQARNAPHFLAQVNKAFCELLKTVPSPLFASAFYFVADTTGRVATFSSAGHPAPYRLVRSLSRITRLEVPPPRGTALGVMPQETYTGGHCRLLPDDVIIFYTDGLYEIHNEAGDEFGMERMQQELRRLMYKHPPRKIVDGLLQAARDFAGEEPIADDICIIAVAVTTESARKPEFNDD